MALAATAVLLIVIGGLLWIRSQPSVETATMTIDLRERSVARGENPGQTGQPPIELSRRTRHLVLDLPVGSNEGTYDLALLNGNGSELLRLAGTAKLEDHIVVLRAETDFAGVSPGSYILGLRQQGMEWTRFPIRVL